MKLQEFSEPFSSRIKGSQNIDLKRMVEGTEYSIMITFHSLANNHDGCLVNKHLVEQLLFAPETMLGGSGETRRWS